MTVTRKEVAEYAKVSVATISHVINNSKNVSDEVRQRVEEAIKVLGYQPNLVARGLVTKKTYHVAMFVNNLRNSYYSEMLEGAQHVASKYGYIVSIIMIDYSNQNEILQIASRGVDGVILATARVEELAAILDGKIPYSTTGDNIDIDYRPAIFEAVEKLKNLGHEKIAYLSGLKITNPPHNRLKHLQDAFKHYGIKLNEKLLIDGNQTQDTNEQAGMEAVQKLIKTGEEFTAVIALNDLMAAGAIRELRLHGLLVPEDVSVVGCDNTALSKFYSPGISTIDVQAFEVGKLLMHQLIHMMEHKKLTKKIVPTSFIMRESIGPV